MLWTVALIILSFFAVLGVILCVITLIETVSVNRYTPDDAVLSVSLGGAIENVPFLLNTLLLQAGRIRYRGVVTRVVVVDVGMDERTLTQVRDFCKENDNISVEL